MAKEKSIGTLPPETPPRGLPPRRSVHTSHFPAILQELGITRVVTTYQAGKVVILRADGNVRNTDFRSFRRPMGRAGDRLAMGTNWEIWEHHDVPAAARRLEPPEKHDNCFLPRTAAVTGDIPIHEMAWVGDDLWFVNTRFSCRCTRSNVHNFVPRWRPAFVTALAPEDRCQLNGLCIVPTRSVSPGA